MDIRKLQQVLALADTLHFGKAGDLVNLSQPALSRSLRALEEELGVRLFERDAHGVQMTAYGQTVVARARRIVFDAMQMRNEIRDLARGDYGEVTIGLGATPAHLLAAPLLVEGSKLASGSRIRIRRGATERLLDMLNDGKLDFFCADITPFGSLVDHGNLEIRTLPQWPIGFFCRAGHPLASEPAIFPDMLRRYPIASTSLSSIALARLQALSGLTESFAPYIAMDSDSIEDIALSTMHSDAVLLASRPVVWQKLQEGKLQEIKLDFIATSRGGQFGIVTRVHAQMPPLAQRLMAVAFEIFEKFAMLARQDVSARH
jgi:DNA-binding transcriptional LysR family regulator